MSSLPMADVTTPTNLVHFELFEKILISPLLLVKLQTQHFNEVMQMKSLRNCEEKIYTAMSTLQENFSWISKIIFTHVHYLLQFLSFERIDHIIEILNTSDPSQSLWRERESHNGKEIKWCSTLLMRLSALLWTSGSAMEVSEMISSR